ncbi:MAG: tyrosine-type recombinase/integrase [bacterium]
MLKENLDLFKGYLKAEKGYADGTISEYSRDVERLFEYHNATDINLSMEQISQWLNYLITDKGVSPRTRNRKLASIRSFYKCMKKYKKIDNNPTDEIDCSKVEKKSKVTYLNLNQIQSFLNAIENYPHNTNKLRDMAIIKLFFYSGLREGELVNLDITDLDFKVDIIDVRPEISKGNKGRQIPLHKEAKKVILEYLDNRDDDIPALFISTRMKRISTNTIYQIVKKYAAETRIGIKDQIHPHVLRSSFATNLYHQTKDIKTLQELLGHSDISTTQIYVKPNEQVRSNAVNSLPAF